MAVETVYDRGWSGLQNGELLNRAIESFDVFFTADQNLPYQQNLAGRGIRVVVLAAVTNRVDDLVPLLGRAPRSREPTGARCSGSRPFGFRVSNMTRAIEPDGPPLKDSTWVDRSVERCKLVTESSSAAPETSERYLSCLRPLRVEFA